MAEPGFFASPSMGDVGAPSTPSKKAMSSAGATSSKKKKRRSQVTSSGAAGLTKKKIKISKDPTGQQTPKTVPSRRPLSGFDLAGRPGLLLDTDNSGIRSVTKKIIRPLGTATINTDTEWNFVLNTRKNEYVRFYSDSMTTSLYSSVLNAAFDDAAEAGNINAARRHSAVSLEGHPNVFMDPSVMGTSLVKGVRVSINGVPVQTNSLMEPHLLHYVRACRIFNSRPGPYIARQDQLTVGAHPARGTLKDPIRAGLRPFDHIAWANTRPNRIPIYLDGIWPFDHRNRTVESVDQNPEPPLYFPPDSRIEITVELHRDKFVGVFHEHVNDYAEYFNVAARQASTVQTTVIDVLLEYESCELSPWEHDHVIQQYRQGALGKYDYDIVRSQHQTLDAGVAYCIRWFQIQPHCRFVYIMWLPNHAIFSMPATNKPISAWSRFPQHCTGLTVGFASEKALITEQLENFGRNERNNEISKKIFFDYLTSNRMFAGTFEEFFSGENGTQSLIQMLALDLKHLDSVKTERLTVEMEFSADASPTNQQILVLSVHNNGRAVCSADKTVHDWKWDFITL